MRINWNYPPVRRGLAGAIDRFIGPGATPAEVLLQTLLPLVAALVAVVYGMLQMPEWSYLQLFMCGLLALDISGGIITNATSTAKRWYHRSGQSIRQHMNFILLHFLQLFLVAYFFLSFDWVWLMVAGGYLVVSALIILMTSVYLQRPVAMILYSMAFLISLYGLAQPEGMEWFLPLFYCKLLVSHLPHEEPYRPDSESLS
ncbi:hypothetical protein EBI01_09865 [Marinomonas rhizomae]|uniref:Uncharacterized protein n=1 Tax=Marinomonas rhizomae TaxID=491948 RepID=A0A366JBY9_9GAMM|nr:hypothetical protein [Marinomonas rhizomae]RBP83814.1 hypothetical protein DFP80_105134 [Marinomonas rhizomae]RNF73475.1 hypothetical protein EBI01_09865 [Marinomonas rhizomae]